MATDQSTIGVLALYPVLLRPCSKGLVVVVLCGQNHELLTAYSPNIARQAIVMHKHYACCTMAGMGKVSQKSVHRCRLDQQARGD